MNIFREAFRWICNPTAIKKAPSERLPGGIDWHCHILPGVDDGFQEVKKSLEMLCLYEGAGMRDVWFTPHIMEDVPNETTHLRQVFANFQKQYQQDFAERNPADRKNAPAASRSRKYARCALRKAPEGKRPVAAGRGWQTPVGGDEHLLCPDEFPCPPGAHQEQGLHARACPS